MNVAIAHGWGEGAEDNIKASFLRSYDSVDLSGSQLIVARTLKCGSKINNINKSWIAKVLRIWQCTWIANCDVLSAYEYNQLPSPIKSIYRQ